MRAGITEPSACESEALNISYAQPTEIRAITLKTLVPFHIAESFHEYLVRKVQNTEGSKSWPGAYVIRLSKLASRGVQVFGEICQQLDLFA
jgi:hypothetical protein